MRGLVVLSILFLPVSAYAGTDVIATCYEACEASTNSNPEFKACLARAADAADRKLNDAYKQLQGAIRAGAKEMGRAPDDACRTRRTVSNLRATPVSTGEPPCASARSTASAGSLRSSSRTAKR